MARARSKKLLIAIVEDDQAVLHSLAFDLEAQGYDVRVFENALQTLESPRLSDVDCLVIDYGLPGMHGAALLGSLRFRGLQCPAVFIASNPSVRCRMEIEAAGAPLVEKPLMGDVLSDQIRALL